MADVGDIPAPVADVKLFGLWSFDVEVSIRRFITSLTLYDVLLFKEKFAAGAQHLICFTYRLPTISPLWITLL